MADITSDNTLHVEDLDVQTFEHVLGFLTLKDCCLIACTSSRFRSRVDRYPLWGTVARSYFGLDFPSPSRAFPTAQVVNNTKAAASFKAATLDWVNEFGFDYGSTFPRVWRMWSHLEEWTREHAPHVYNTLASGATEGQIDSAEKSLGVQLPSSMRIIYRIHNGQVARGWLQGGGLFGGYQFYDYSMCVRMLPLDLVVKRTKELTGRGQLDSESGFVVVAADSDFRKVFIVNTQTGDIFLRTPSRVLIQAAPTGLDDLRDGFLRWMEDYGTRLKEHYFGVSTFRSRGEESQGSIISLYPLKGSGYSEAVTNGVRVQAGAVFVPELSHPPLDCRFAFSVHFYLLTNEAPVAERTPDEECYQLPKSIQLKSRRWETKNANNDLEESKGCGVVGKCPILSNCHPSFAYQSCTELSSLPCKMQGEFSFVPGTIDSPKGHDFSVMCASFDLNIPDFVH